MIFFGGDRVNHQPAIVSIIPAQYRWQQHIISSDKDTFSSSMYHVSIHPVTTDSHYVLCIHHIGWTKNGYIYIYKWYGKSDPYGQAHIVGEPIHSRTVAFLHPCCCLISEKSTIPSMFLWLNHDEPPYHPQTNSIFHGSKSANLSMVESWVPSIPFRCCLNREKSMVYLDESHFFMCDA